MRTLAILVPLLFLVANAPTALAHECPEHAEAARIAGYYLTPDAKVFQETNGISGLQRTAGSCEDDNGRFWSWVADTPVV